MQNRKIGPQPPAPPHSCDIVRIHAVPDAWMWGTVKYRAIGRFRERL